MKVKNFDANYEKIKNNKKQNIRKEIQEVFLSTTIS